MLLFVLKQKDTTIAAAEAKAASLGWGWWKNSTEAINGTLLLDSRKRPKYLALSRFAVKVMVTCKPTDIKETLAAVNWNKIVKNSYKVVLTKQVESKESERELAKVIWQKIRKPKVDLENPKIIIDIIITSKEIYVGARIWENGEDFESRRAHLRPELHPSSMHPALARALVNLACVKSIHDPFCGSGGILIEAGLSHHRTSGADIEQQMITRAKKNCTAYKLRPELRIADATQWIPRIGALVCDLPYGKNTRPVALNNLVEAFLLRAAQSTKRIVLGVPVPIEISGEWKIRAHFTSYVHKSMTKHFYILERNQA
jgi:tRNA (guanine10-N2)-dimethyltransferase